MDSKPTFGILLVIVGLAGMWALVTGKFSGLLNPTSTGSTTSTTTNPAANVVGGNAAPLGGSTLNPKPAPLQTGDRTMATLNTGVGMNLGSSVLAYQVVVGDTGAKIEPIGSASYG